MDLSIAVARLAALTRILDDADNASILQDLARSALAVVPSSLAVLAVMDGRPGPLATVSDRYRRTNFSAHSSLRLELTSRSSERPRTHWLIFLAEDKDAFSEFTGLSASASGSAPDDSMTQPQHQLTGIVIDADLGDDDPNRRHARSSPARPTGHVDRAIGFLIDRGHEPAEASGVVESRARLWKVPPQEAADRILRSLE